MGRKHKLRKFAEVRSFPNVYECYDMENPTLVDEALRPVDLRGRWVSEAFGNDHPLVLELACGGGEYTVEMARRYPDKNFVGVDIKGNRLWKGARQALDEGLTNAAFLRTRIEFIAHFFAPNEVQELWITFPDPFPKASKENRRLTAPVFLERYRAILAPGGPVHLKHDDPDFFQYTLNTVAADTRCTLLYANHDLYAAPLDFPELGIQTLYESKHLAAGKTIKYARFTLHGASS